MTPRRDDLVRLGLLLAGLLVLVALLSLAFAAAGRNAHQAMAAGAGVVGLGLAAAGLVLLVLARRGSTRVSHVTAMGTLGLAVVLLGAALVV